MWLLQKNMVFIYLRLISSLIFKHIIIPVNSQEKMLWILACSCQSWGATRSEAARINRFRARCISQGVRNTRSSHLTIPGMYCTCTGMFFRSNETVPAVLSFEVWNLSSKKWEQTPDVKEWTSKERKFQRGQCSAPTNTGQQPGCNYIKKINLYKACGTEKYLRLQIIWSLSKCTWY